MRRNSWVVNSTNIALSLLIVAIFVYLLMLAMAQDQILAKLSRGADFANYSASLSDARKAKANSEQIDALAETRKERREEVARLESQAAWAEILYEREVGRLGPILATLKGVPGCQISDNPIVAVDGQTQQETEMKVTQVELAVALECFESDSQLGGDRRSRYLATLANAKKLSDDAVRADMARKVKTQQSKALQDEINRLVADTKKLAPARVQFTMLDSLEFEWLPINFINYPPFIVRVLLTIFSGAFGALLITMVFIVFPSKLRERVSAKLYYKRIFLGGIVALTVFIVLTGGAAILGTSDVSTDDANVMSFTAIGLLAGMFSDRVADWLSARARKMFSSGDEDDDETDGKGDAAGDEPARTA